METKTQDDGTLLAISNKGDVDAYKRTTDCFDEISRADCENDHVYADGEPDPIEVARDIRKILKRFAPKPAEKEKAKPADK